MNGPVLVTGAGGFAGSHLVEHLATLGVHAEAWTRAQVELRDRHAVRAAVDALKPATIFHLAGMPRVADSFADTVQPLESNVLATHYLFDALRRGGRPARVLLTSSALVYAKSDRPLREDDAIQPPNPYALSKLAQEQLGLRGATDYGLDVIVTRPFNHTGPRQPPAFVAPSLARQVARIERGGEPVIHIGNMESVRDMSDVRDVVRAYALLMEHGTPGTVYNIGSGVGRTVRSLLDAMVSRANRPITIAVDPERFRPQDTPVLTADITRLQAATGWQPRVGFDQMIDDLLDWWRRN